MIYDQRTYTCKPGTIAKQLAIYEKYGFAPQTKNLGQPLLFAMTEVGEINSYVHIWAYKDLAERDAKRAAMMAEPDWQTYLKESTEAGYLVHQENTIRKSVPFITPS